MKLYLAILSFWVLLMFGCTNTAEDPTNNTGLGDISETTLPKGKYIIEDDIIAKKFNDNSGSINDYNGNKTDAGTSNTTNTGNLDANLKRRFKNLLVFHAADTMKIKKSYLATLILGKDQILGDLKAEVLENANSNDEKIKQDTTLDIGSKMRARLIDMSGATNKGFDIELIGGEDAATQSITEKRKRIIWQWKLTPLTPGQQELKLSINIIEKDGETVNLPARNIPVVIFAEQASIGSKIASFFDENIKWILASILIPVFIAWFGAKMRQKFDKRDSFSNAKSNMSSTAAPQNENTSAQIIKPLQTNEGSE
jgi:hypothetical protein